MPWTLYRYILREVLKVLVLTTAVLVVVLSFLTAIGPLADGLLGPLQLLKYLMYTVPTVLGFALPFAGAFSATVVFHSLTKENELLACRAGGLSYSRIFAPVVALGLVLMVVLLLLSNTVVPRFMRAATKTLEGDVLGVLVSQLNQNRPYTFGEAGLVLYADAAEKRDPPEGSGAEGLKAEQYIVMQGVAVGQYDEQSQRMLNDTTASSASALLVRDAFGKAYITMRLKDPLFFDAVTGEIATAGRMGDVQTDRPILLDNPIVDEAEFFSLAQLFALKRHPHDFDKVREAKSRLAATVMRQQMQRQIQQNLSGDNGYGFVTLRGGLGNTFYRLTAPMVESTDAGLVLTGTDQLRVTIDKYDNEKLLGEPVRRFEADYAELRVETDRFDLKPKAQVTMQNVRVFSLNETGEATDKGSYTFPAMRYTGIEAQADTQQMSVEEIDAWARQYEVSEDGPIREARAWLRFRIIQLKYMIDAELYTRASTALATPLLLVLGALLAVRLRDKLPLVVFFWSFLLAVVTLVMINTGSGMVERVFLEVALSGIPPNRVVGISVLWGGNLILLFIIGRLYLRIAQH